MRVWQRNLRLLDELMLLARSQLVHVKLYKLLWCGQQSIVVFVVWRVFILVHLEKLVPAELEYKTWDRLTLD